MFRSWRLYLTSSLAAVLLFACARQLRAAAPAASIDPVPHEVSSDHFRISVGDATAPVLHAAAGYYLTSLETTGPVPVSITADDPHYWDAGVEVQPMRFGIRPERHGATITFTVPGPVKLSITRPGDFFGNSEMLFLFANAPDAAAPVRGAPHVRYFAPGVYRVNIDARSGDRIFLAPGAVVFGALNIWGVHDVDVSGRGTLIYDGPQDPDHDQGWMHKRNWHGIVMDRASHIRIQGITAIVRSRTWMIQMRDSHGIEFNNIKVIGGSPGNANQDGMDWLGGGDTIVRNSFFRAADDVFAMYGNWDGYEPQKLMRPGHDVTNITVEGSTLSTSISNIVRLGWPEKTFNSRGFTLRDSDVLHMGFGSCKVPFALFELWADPGGHGLHREIHFDDIRLDHWYSLTQVLQPKPAVRNVSFTNVWSLNGPAMLPSTLSGDVSGVSLQGVDLGQAGSPPFDVLAGAEPPQVAPGALDASFDVPGGLIRPGEPVPFHAHGAPDPSLTYTWIFGDGATAQGASVTHAFPDTDGTLLDGSGRFRVLLHVTGSAAQQAWSSQSVVVGDHLQPPVAREAAGADDIFFDVPQDGGYTFTLLTGTGAGLQIDDLGPVAGPTPRSQVCGTPGFAVQPVRASAALAAGLHRIRVTPGEVPQPRNSLHPMLLWEGPGVERRPLATHP